MTDSTATLEATDNEAAPAKKAAAKKAPAKKAAAKKAAAKRAKAPVGTPEETVSTTNGVVERDGKVANMADPVDLADLFDETGLVLDADVSFDQWMRLGDNLLRMARADKWWIGDWALFGEAKFEDQASQALDPTSSLDPKTVSNARWVSGQIPKKDRVAELSWTHHRIAAELPTPALIRKALRVAVKEVMSTRDLQRWVNNQKPAKEGEAAEKKAKTVKTFTLSFSVDVQDEKAGAIVHAAAKMFVEAQAKEQGFDLTNISVRVS